jgi:hypothetical protein
MKNNLENTFKDKLTEFEAPYDPQAWNAVKSQLDAKATGGGSSSTWKWIAATAVVATIAVTSILLFESKETKTADVKSVSEENATNNDIEKPLTISVKESSEELNGNIDNGSDLENPTIELDENLDDQAILEEEFDNNTEKNIIGDVAEENDNTEAIKPSDNRKSVVPANVQSTPKPNKHKYTTGNVSSNQICYGELIKITNTGAKNEIVRFELNGKTIELKKAGTFEVQPENSIVINFINKDNKIIDSEYIKVNELPNPDFNYEANIFEKGLPVTICEAYGNYENISWDFDGQSEKEGKKVRHHFFEKGNHTVTLTVKDFNGCEKSKQKEVRIENQYNLMAVSGFKPNGSEPSTKTFMPFCLTQRDVNFTLTIIDPRDNGVVFTSKDASNAWTGIDERTGNMTDSETTFIWKVQLENSLPNERPVYAGTVVHN